MSIIREKPHRLSPDFYKGERCVSFTANERQRRRAFASREIFSMMEASLLRACEQHRCIADVYVAMPDHAHIVLSGLVDGDVYHAMTKFKQLTGHWFSTSRSGVQWQKNFFDRVIRNERDFEDHILYTLNNPVRAGIVDDWRAYEFKGSMRFDLDSWEGIIRGWR